MALVEGAGFEARVVGKGAIADCDSAILRVSGMTCSSCSSAVEAALTNHKGVKAGLYELRTLIDRGKHVHCQHWLNPAHCIVIRRTVYSC